MSALEPLEKIPVALISQIGKLRVIRKGNCLVIQVATDKEQTWNWDIHLPSQSTLNSTKMKSKNKRNNLMTVVKWDIRVKFLKKLSMDFSFKFLSLYERDQARSLGDQTP